ncbi:MAG: MlaE family ABC transporter permease [Pseudomonadota bacterium]
MEPDDHGRRPSRALGDWTLPHYPALARRVERLRPASLPELDLTHVGALDTAGASLLVRLTGTDAAAALDTAASGLPPERLALLQAVADASARCADHAPPRHHPALDELARIGRVLVEVLTMLHLLLAFIGLSVLTLARGGFRPGHWRVNALVNQIEQTGLNAVPIVALLTFMVGAVIAFLGATVLADFGASAYTVDLVAFAFMREFGVLLSAVLLAGRTASAFTAQLGAMKSNQEIDALRVQGLDPMELLVAPRLLALLLTLPMLTFIAVMSGLTGGAVVAVGTLDMPLVQVLATIGDVPIRHFLVGLAKAPVFAFVIGAIGCLEGFKVTGSAESVGAHTTSSVVQAIFLVILLDAVAALYFQEVGL